MKETRALILLLICVLSLIGCSSTSSKKDASSNAIEDIRKGDPAFSYEEELEMYRETSPGVKYDGFINTSEYVIRNSQQAVARAKREVTLAYNKTSVYYDREADIWKVVFYTEGSLGGDQTVYLAGNGMTNLIVYGE